jgi:hypothetical protein
MQQVVEDGRKWAMFMVAGGHFAGAVVRVSKAEEDEEPVDEGSAKKKKKPKKPKPDTEVLNHKTFHRYTSEHYGYHQFSLLLLTAFYHSPSKARRLSVTERQCKRQRKKCWCPASSLW